MTPQLPVLVPAPQVLGQEGLRLTFQVFGSDPNGGSLVWYAQDLPPGAVFNPATQVLSWTPGFDQSGVYNPRFSARNPAGLEATTAALVQILNVNRPPVFAPPAARQVIAGNEIKVTVQATDSDAGDVLTFSAANLPTGATFDAATGTLVWRPGGVQAGRYDIPITVSDGRLSVSQTLPIIVSTEPQLPQVRLELTPSFPVVPGAAVVIQATAQGVAPIASIQILVDGVLQTLDQFGRVTLHPANPGQINIVARATDADGFTGGATTILKVRDPADRDAPVIAIDVPPTNTVLSAPVTVRGSVADANLDFWRVELRPLGSDSVSTLGSGTAPVSGDLGVIDTSRLENGPYLLSLIAQDISGRVTRIDRVVEVNSADKAAAFVRTETDVSATLDGLTIPIVRRYSSLSAAQDGLFGLGWQFVLAEPRFSANVPATGREADGLYTAFTRDTRVYVTLPSGERTSFSFTPQAVTVGGLTFYQPAWTATAAGTTFTLSSGTALLEDRGGAFFQVGTGLPYNPASGRFGAFDYSLTAADGARYSYTVAAGLRELSGANGITLVWTDAGFTAANGDRLPVEKDSSGRIARVVAPNGDSAIYSYSATGSLLQVTRLEAGKRTWLGYRAENGRLLTEVAGDNAVSVRYDATGAVAGVDPIRAVLGTTKQFLGASPTGTLNPGATDLYAIVLGAAELASSSNGLVTLGFEVTGSGGFNPAPAGLRGSTPVFTSVGPGHSLALYTLRSPGPLAVEIAGADAATTGGYSVRIFLVGDVNGDAAIDGTDEALFNSAFGSASGQVAYNAAADFNGDGRVDDADRAYLQAGFGFVALRPPTMSAVSRTTAGGVPVSVDLSALGTDPQGSPVFFSIGNASGGTVRLLDGTRTAVFTPAPGFTGTGGFDVRVDNLSLGSNPARITIEMLATPLVNLRFSADSPNLQPGEIKQLAVLGDLPDGTTLRLDPSQFTVSSTDPTVAQAARDGSVLGVGAGSTTIVFDLGGGKQIATSVTVGAVADRRVDFFPDSYALEANNTRQFVVRERIGDTISDRAAAAQGTRYFLSDPAVASITADGLLTGLQAGEVTVSVVNGGRSIQSRILVTSPLANGSAVGAKGGVVSDGNISVGVPAGALDSSRPVSVTALTQADAPLEILPGFDFAGGLRIDYGGGATASPLSIAMNAPAGFAAGRQVFMFQPVTMRRGDGQPDQQVWLLLDSLTVGNDGKMRTTSPPNLGFAGRFLSDNTSILFVPSMASTAFMMSPSIVGALNALADQSLRAQAYGAGVVSLQTFFGGSPRGPLFLTVTSALGDLLLPATFTFQYKLQSYNTTPKGMVPIGNATDVLIKPGQTATYALPFPPRFIVRDATQPTITSAQFDFGTNPNSPQRRVLISGKDFLLAQPLYAGASSLGMSYTDLFVTFEIGGRDTFNPDGTVNPVGGSDIIIPGSLLTPDGKGGIIVPVPQGAQVAGAYITVTRPMQVPLAGKFETQNFISNPVQLVPPARYTFGANGGDDSISVFDATQTVTVSGTGGVMVPKVNAQEIARIALGPPGGNLAPSHIATTADGTRAYVTLNGSAEIAVIDAVALQEIDTNSKAGGIQRIALPIAAQPFDVAIEKGGRYLYVSDQNVGAIYVIDIDPFSPTYHQHVQTINVPAGLGLRGMALSADDSTLFVTAPGQTLFGKYNQPTGSLFVIETNAATHKAPQYGASANPSEIQVGPEPYDITATDDPNVMLFVDRLSDAQGVGVLRRHSLPSGAVFYDVNYVDLRPFGQVPRFIEGRTTQVFGVTNASSIVFLPADALKDVIGPHPSYAFITGYNKFVPNDPKKDPNIGPILAYNYYFTGSDGKPIGIPLAAGSNVGIIRNPLGDFTDPLAKPRIVAATTPIINGFADNVTIAPFSNALMVSMQGQNRVFVYDSRFLIARIEKEVKAGATTPITDFSQISTGVDVPDPLSRLLRGPLSSVPIDVVDPLTKIQADFRYFSGPKDPTGAEPIFYGVPPTGPFGETPNQNAPIIAGRLPRGLAGQKALSLNVLGLAPTPYNQTPTLNAYPNDPLTVQAGRASTADAHTGAFSETDSLVTYRSLNQDRGYQLAYDSLRADPLDIYYFAVAGIKNPDPADRFITRLSVRNGDYFKQADGLAIAQASQLGLSGGEMFFKFPAALDPAGNYGAGIPLDLTGADTGLYTLSLDYGEFHSDSSGKYVGGRFATFTQPYAVVNSQESMFGAGWGMAGLYEIFSGDSGALLVNGNGHEEIYLAPPSPTQPFTSLSPADGMVLSQDTNGLFVLRDKYGTRWNFDSNGKVSSMTDRNDNATLYTWQTVTIGKKSVSQLTQITDPVGLTTQFIYNGNRVSQIKDPANRITQLAYDGNGNLISITDPDGSKRTFEYNNSTLTHLMTGQVSKRGNDPKETFNSTFHESITYNQLGRVTGGTRIDGKTFTLTAAQMLNVVDPKIAADPAQGGQIALLAMTDAERIRFLAKATYKDFDGKDLTIEMTGYGQYARSKDNSDGTTTKSDRDVNGYISSQTDGDKNVIEIRTDFFGNMVQRTDYPDGPGTSRAVTETYTYDPDFSMLLTKVDGMKRTTTNVLDAHGNAMSTTIVDPNVPKGAIGTAVLKYTYYSNGLMKTSTDANGNTTSFIYDKYGRATEIDYADGTSRQYQYADLTGNPTATIDETGVRTDFVYDAMNRQKDRSVTMASLKGQTYHWKTDYDAAGNRIQTTDSNGVITKYQYEVLDRVILQVVDPAGLNLVSHIAYAVGVISPGYAIDTSDPTYTYRFVQNPRGFTTTEIYDKKGRLRFQYDELGNVTKFGYDAANQLIQRVLPDGSVINLKLDGRGRTISETGPTQEYTQYFYDDANRQIKTIQHDNANGGDRTTLRTYNIWDTVATITDAAGVVTQFEFDAGGNITKRIDAAGTKVEFSTTYSYDKRNREISRTLNGVATITTDYWPDGQVKSVSDPRDKSFKSLYVYDELKRRIEVHDAAGDTTLLFYDGEGNLLASIDPRGGGDPTNTTYRTNYKYDARNRLILTTDPLGNKTKYDYDGAGNRTLVVDQRGNPTKSTYDAANRLISVTDALGGVTRYGYDAVGNRTKMEDPRGAAYRTTYQFDFSRRLTKITDALGQVTTFTYDQVGNLIREVGPQGFNYRTEYTYDLLDRRLTTARAPGTKDATSSSTTYDATGLVIATTDGLNHQTVYTYDALRHVISVTQAAGTPDAITTRFQVDEAGNRTAVIDPRGAFYTTLYEYDSVNRLVKTTQPFGTPTAAGKPIVINYTYDAAGNKLTESDPRNSAWLTTVEYDALNRVTARIDQAGHRTETTYDPAGNPKTLKDANGNVTTYNYDPLNRRSSIVEADNATTTFVYDPAGNLLQKIGPRSPSAGGAPYSVQYKYDLIGRRVQQTDPEGNVSTFSYDAGSNLIQTVDPRSAVKGATTTYSTTFTYDFLNRVTSVTRVVGNGVPDVVEQYTYDAAGNRLTSTDARGFTTTYGYDNLNRLVQLTQPPANDGGADRVTTYGYDAAGNQTSITDPRGAFYTTVFVYDAANRLVEEDRPQGTAGSGASPAIFTYERDEAGNVLKATDGRGAFYTTIYAYDKTGRIVSQTRPQGTSAASLPAVTETFNYDAVGNLLTRVSPRLDPAGNNYVTTYTYDSRNRIKSVVDAEGNETDFTYDGGSNLLKRVENDHQTGQSRTYDYTYDGMDRQTSETLDGTFTTSYTYDAAGNMTSISGPLSDAKGNLYVETRTYDGLNRIIQTVDRGGYTTIYQFDEVGNLTATTDGRGFTTKRTYSPAGFLSSVSQPSGSPGSPGPDYVTQYIYDDNGNAIQVIDPRGAAFAVTSVFDAQNRAIQVSRPVDKNSTAVTKFEFDAVGNNTKLTDPAGRVTVNQYDAQNREIRTTHPAGTAASPATLDETFNYDAAGDLVQRVGVGGAAFVTTFTYDGLNRLTSMTDAEGQTASWVYDRWGNRLVDRAPYGGAKFTYDDLNRPLTRTDDYGATRSFKYTGTSSTVKTTDENGNTTVSDFDGLARLIAETDPDGNVTKYSYDAAGNRISVTDRRGVRSDFVFDARNILLSETRDAGSATAAVSATYTYDEIGRMISVTDFRGAFYRTDYVYDGLGRRIEMDAQIGTPKSPLVAVTKTDYDLVGNKIAETDPRGFKTTYVYDLRDQLIETDRPDGTVAAPETAVELRGYDDAGFLTKVTSPLGHVTTYAYDKVGRITSQIIETPATPGNSTGEITSSWSYDYVGGNFFVSQTDAAGVTVKTTYDHNHRPVKIEDPRAGTTVITYDPAGNVTERATGRLVTDYTYDKLNRLVKTTDGTGNFRASKYDEEGNVVQESDALNQSTFYTVDNLGRVTSVQAADGGITTKQYDAVDNVTYLRDPVGNISQFTYAGNNRVLTDTNSSGVRTYTYDAAGNLIKYIDRDGREIDYTYDRANRRVQEAWIAGGKAVTTITTNYDLGGNATDLTDGQTTDAMSYSADNLSFLLSETLTYPNGIFNATLTYARDPLGKTTQVDLSINSGPALVSNSYRYDATTDRLSNIVQTGSFVAAKRVDFTYQPDINAPDQIIRYTGSGTSQQVATSTFTVDSRGLITLLKHKLASGAVLNSFDVTYNANALVSVVTSNDGKATYSYDSRNQLIGVTYTDPAMPTETYAYDKAGNRTSSQRQNGLVISTDNRPTQSSNAAYTYDAEGNLTRHVDSNAREVSDYTWDYRNRLTQVVVQDLGGVVLRTVHYTYDPLDRRLSEEVINSTLTDKSNTVRYFVNDGGTVLLELLDPDGLGGGQKASPVVAYFHGLRTDQIFAQDTGSTGQVLWLFADQQGTIRDVIRSDGTLADHQKVDSFGNIITRTSPSLYQPYAFIGRPFDAAINLYYLRARFYDPDIGRFISSDPLGFATGDYNTFRYAFNDPVNLADPSGLAPQSGANLVAQSHQAIDAEADANSAWWKGFASYFTSEWGVSYDVRTVKGKDGKIHDASGWEFSIAGALRARYEHAQFNLTNELKFGYGFLKGGFNLLKELALTAFDVGQLVFGSTQEGFQSQLFKLTFNIHDLPSAASAAVMVIAAPVIGFWQLGQAIASGDPEKAGEQTIGVLPLPTRLGSLRGLKFSTGVFETLGAFAENLKPPPFWNLPRATAKGITSLGERIEGSRAFAIGSELAAAYRGEGILRSVKGVNEFITYQGGGISALLSHGATIVSEVSGAAKASIMRSFAAARELGISGAVEKIAEGYSKTKKDLADYFKQAFGNDAHVTGTRAEALAQASEKDYHTLAREREPEFWMDAYKEARQDGNTGWQAQKIADSRLADYRANIPREARRLLEDDIRNLVFEDALSHGKREFDALAAGQEAVNKFRAEAERVKNPEQLYIDRDWFKRQIGLEQKKAADWYGRNLSEGEAFIQVLGGDKSLLEGLRAGDTTAVALVYLLKEQQEWGNLRKILLEEVKGGRTLEQFKQYGATDARIFEGLAKATAEIPELRGKQLAVVGSFATDLVTFANRHQLVVAAREGRINLRALQEAYGKSGEAAVLGRVIPDMGKKGGPFSDAGDFDFLIINPASKRSLPGQEAIVFTDRLAEYEMANIVRRQLPKEYRRLPADFDYAKYENGSLRGQFESVRGRAVFENGSFRGRDQSILYGEGGAILRDLGQYFDKGPGPLQVRNPNLNSVVNAENIARFGLALAETPYFFIDLEQRATTANFSLDLNQYILTQSDRTSGEKNGRTIQFDIPPDQQWDPTYANPLGFARGLAATSQSTAATVVNPIVGLINQATVNFFSAVLVAYDKLGPHSLEPPPTVPPPDSGGPPALENGAIGTTAEPGSVKSLPPASNGSAPSLRADPADGGRNLGSNDGQLLDASTGQVSDALLRVVDAAKLWWSRQLGYTPALDVRLEVADLPAGRLGWAQLLSTTPDGRPSAGRIVISANGDGRGWFVDPSPMDATEFSGSSTQGLRALPGSPADGRYDLLTLVLHELGHLLGFTQNFSGFASLVAQGLGGASFFVGDGLHELLTADGDHLSPVTRPGALMTPYLAAGVRRQPSELEGQMLRAAWDAAEADRNAGGKPSFQLAPGVFGFTVLSETAAAGLDNPNATLVNGGFSVSGAASGWTLIGGASITSGQGMLARGSGMLSELVQTFTVPDRAQTLQFTVTGFQLAGGGALPPDAFEVGLFDTSTGGSLLPTVTLSGTDSIVNLQGGGALTLGSGVRLVSGSVGSGGALVFSVDLSGVTAGTVATLTFDLVGIGNRGSHVAVDDVTLVTTPDVALPVVTNESYTTTRNLPLDVPAARGVLANDSDPFNRPLTATLVQAPSNGTLDLNPDGSFRYVPNQDFVGQDQFVYRDRTGSVVSDLGTVTIVVTALEQRPPQFVKGADQTVAENAGAQHIVGWATNIAAGLPAPGAGATLNFVLSLDRPELFAALPTVSADGTLTFEAKAFTSGVAKVTVQLHDNGGTQDGRVDTSDSQVFTITILPVNQPPTFTKGPDIAVAANAGAQTVNNWATGITPGPANEADQSVNFVVTADRPELFAVAPRIAADGTLTFTPSVGAAGRAIVTIVLRDDGGTENGGHDTSEPQSFAITIVSTLPNQPPTFTKGPDVTVAPNAGAQTIDKWATQIAPGPANESSQTVAFIVTADHPELFAVAPQITPNGTLTFTPKDGVFGRAVLTVVLRDNGGTDNGGHDTSAPQSFAIVIASPSVNQPPAFTKGPDVSVSSNAGAQTIDNWATDITPGPANESTQTVNFVVTVDHPELFTVAPQIAPNGTLTFTPNAGGFGRAVVTVVAHDNGGTDNGGQDTSSPQAFAIIIASPSANQPPAFTKGPDVSVPSNAGAQTIDNWATSITPGPANESGQTVNFVLTVDHPELFAVAPQIAPNGTLTFTPNAGGFGRAVVTVVAHDNGGTDNGGQDTSTPQSFVIQVLYVNQPPTFKAGPDVTVNQDSGPQKIIGWATEIQPGPAGAPVSKVTFTLTSDRPELFAAPPQLTSDGTLSFTPAPGVFGSATVSVFARNDGGTANGGRDTSNIQTFTISITPLPVNGGGGLVWLQVNAPVRPSLLGAPFDGGAPVKLQILEGPPWLTVDPSTGLLTGTPKRGDPGISRLVVSATTPTGGVVTQAFVLALYRPTQPPDEWVPWAHVNWVSGISDITGTVAAPSSRGLHIASVWGRTPKRLESAVVRMVGGRIVIELPMKVSVIAVRVISAGTDRLLGTADDIDLPVRRSAVSADGTEIIIELSGASAWERPLQIEIQTEGESYIVRID